MTQASSFEVHAAGCVVWRRSSRGLEFALAHRPRYDDWSLPKGKLDPGETFEAAAAREVEEEIGVRGRLGDELPEVSYYDNKGRSKLVRYWLMEAPGEGDSFAANDEVDELRWLPAGEAFELLSYSRDRDLLVQAARRLT